MLPVAEKIMQMEPVLKQVPVVKLIVKVAALVGSIFGIISIAQGEKSLSAGRLSSGSDEDDTSYFWPPDIIPHPHPHPDPIPPRVPDPLYGDLA